MISLSLSFFFFFFSFFLRRRSASAIAIETEIKVSKQRTYLGVFSFLFHLILFYFISSYSIPILAYHLISLSHLSISSHVTFRLILLELRIEILNTRDFWNFRTLRFMCSVCFMCSVLCAVCSVLCALCSVCALCSGQCAMCSIYLYISSRIVSLSRNPFGSMRNGVILPFTLILSACCIVFP